MNPRLVITVAVLVVAVVAVLTTVFSPREELAAGTHAPPAIALSQDVVTAPPIAAVPPSAAGAATRQMGGPPSPSDTPQRALPLPNARP
jgi:hypothetical protein